MKQNIPSICQSNPNPLWVYICVSLEYFHTLTSPRAILNWKSAFPFLKQPVSQSDSGPHCARYTNTHSSIYCLCTSSASIQAFFPYHLCNNLSNNLWSDTVKWCLPIKQFRDLSALIFCVLPVLAMMCQSKHFMLNMGPALCCFSFRVG